MYNDVENTLIRVTIQFVCIDFPAWDTSQLLMFAMAAIMLSYHIFTS